MSGHSKWHSIKYKKGAADAKRGKAFTKHAKLISIAARDGGADSEMNSALRTAIINAKADNVPNANIDKAVKKGSGVGKDALILDEIMYEGFGPVGVVFYIHVITDNRNRSVASVKTALTKNGGNMGEAGSVSYMFEKKGLIVAKPVGMNKDDAEMYAIEAGAEDIEFVDDFFEIITEPSQLMKVKENIESAGFVVDKAEFDFIAKNPVHISDLATSQKILKIIDALEEDEDVTNVYSNFDIPEDILEQI